MELEERIKKYIREVPNFPKKGVMFKDFTPLLGEPKICNEIIESLKEKYRSVKIDVLVVVESRGFIFGSLIAHSLGIPMVLARKSGKLPANTLSQTYELEYGLATMEINEGAIKPYCRVLIQDDLLATGGTTEAVGQLVERAGGIIAGYDFLIELEFLNGRKRLKKFKDSEINSLIKYS